MLGNTSAKDNLAAKLDSVLRKFERDGGDIGKLAHSIDQDRADLNRWRKGTTLPGHVLVALQDELPLHLATELTGATRRIVAKSNAEAANDLETISDLLHLGGGWTQALSDSVRDHRETLTLADEIKRLLPKLIAIVAEAEKIAA